MKNQPKLNHQIKASEVRVLTDSGENLGVMELPKALTMAREQGLDLIEVSDKAKPPVVRIMSFDKYRYQEEKKLKKQRSGEKVKEVKQVQVSVRSAKHDLGVKAKRVNEFLEAGHPVALVMTLRGREKANKDWAKKKLEEFLELITTPFQRISNIHPGGRGLVMQIVPTKK